MPRPCPRFLLFVTISSFFMAIGYGLIAFLLLDSLFPLTLNDRPVSTLVTASDGTPLRAFSDRMGIWRYPASKEEVSPLYLEALLTYEDRWFQYHPGVNPLAVARAMVQNIRAGRIVSGGSTLSMQVARILKLNRQVTPSKRRRPQAEKQRNGKGHGGRGKGWNPAAGVSGMDDNTNKGMNRQGRHGTRRRIRGKLYQVFRALQLERHLSKDEILTLYLTHAPFGSNIEGVRTAAYTWLGKDAMELSHAEAALLAVLPQAPSFYRPDRHPQRARKARDKVLERLESLGVWSSEVVTAAKEEPVVAFRCRPPVIAPLAARRLHHQTPHTPLIRTTLDFDLQVHLQGIVKRYVTALFPSTRFSTTSQPSPPLLSTNHLLIHSPNTDQGKLADETESGQSGAALVVNSATMEIKAYIGSADFTSKAGKGHVDMIQALRSPGSTLKPFLYGAAIDEGLIHSHSLLTDTPRYGTKYEPENFTGEFMGPVSAVDALRHSLNVPAVQLLEALGPHRFHDLLKHAGADLQFQGKPNLSMILGGVGINLESLVGLYTALVRGGIAGQPVLETIAPTTIQERYLLSPGAAWIVTQMLRRPLPGYERIQGPSGRLPVAWKTGTSYGFRDAWAVGIMGEYVVGVWVGRPDGTPVPGQYGAVTALPLLERILEAIPVSGGNVHKNVPQKPKTVTRQTICWPLGGLKENTLPHNCLKQHDAWILSGKVPATLPERFLKHASLSTTFWIDDSGNRARPSCGGIEKKTVALWPESVAAWLPPQWRSIHRIPGPSPRCPQMTPIPGNSLQITSIGNSSRLTRPPGETKIPAIPLISMGGSGNIHWFLNRELVAEIAQGNAGALPMPPPGRYQLVAADENGRSDMVLFSVISSGTADKMPRLPNGRRMTTE